ncbi:PAS domain S-box protein [Pedobacter gandavensis]|uniref:GAF domain-containing sensor histidine kinase n=1 Tax=Pedobacter gandavensis TaxID=2679963 RepID=UPI00247A486B|nr:PAS domain S-box protein [Pedobacter gandavensis]WGQ10046.1 PAS domain S-box protein [Pedobacter gandavensis]
MRLDSYPGIEKVGFIQLQQLLDEENKGSFNSIISLAELLCEVPIAFIAIENEDQTLLKTSTISLDTEQSWTLPFSALSILVVPDIRLDNRFSNHYLLKSGICFYASFPVIDTKNVLLAYLCVMDKRPRELSSRQIKGMEHLANQAAESIRLKLDQQDFKKLANDSITATQEIDTIFHNAIDAVIIVDDNGAISQWNPKAEVIFGWLKAEVIGQSFQEVILPSAYHEQYIQLMAHFKYDVAEDYPNSTVEISAIRKDQSIFDIALSISPATIQGRHFYICFVRDITNLNQIAQELDKQQKFYENILNKLPTDIAVFDPDHKYLFVNPGAISIKEYRDFIVGKDDYQYAAYRNRDTATADLRRAQFLEVKNRGKEIRWEDSLKDPEGNTITHLRRMYPVYDENGALSMVIGFGIDITERKIMEEKQAALVQQLSSQNTQLIDFCNIVSHNLRAPLVNMSMLVEFIEDTNNPEEQKTLISKLKPVIDNLHTTFNELVESIQIKQDLEIKSEDILLTDCIRRTFEGLQSEINKSEAIIETDFEEAPSVYFPAKYLYSIFHNLFSNCLKYQSPKRKLVIQLKSQKLDGKILLSFTDNGLGIDMEKHKDNCFKIGKVFHHHPNAKGFGLYMTKTQVEAMKGKIWVESKIDVGSTFFIEFINQRA